MSFVERIKVTDGTEVASVNASNQLEVAEANSNAIKTAVELVDDVVATDGSAALTKLYQVGGTDGTNAQILSTNASGHLNIADGGNSITVDGTVSVSGTVPVSDAGGSLTVDGTVTANLAAGTNNIGDVDVLTVPAPLSTTGGGTEAAALRVTLANDSTGTMAVYGDVAHDAIDGAGKNPIKIGAHAISFGSAITAVGNGDRSHIYSNRHGMLWTIGGHPNLQSAEYITTAAQTDDAILPAIAAGTKYIITGITVIASAANSVNTSVRIGFGTATVPAQGASGADAVTKVILSHPNIPPGSGFSKGYASSVVGVGGDDEELRITCSVPTGGSIVVQVDYFTISG